MTHGLILDLVEKGLVSDQMVLTVGYDTASVTPVLAPGRNDHLGLN